MASPVLASETQLSAAIIALMRGVVDRYEHPRLWQTVDEQQARIRDHLAVIGLELVLIEKDGYAYLRQRPAQGEGAELPRLIPRRPLTYQVSVVLVVLRQRMTEHDAQTGEQRLIITREEIGELVRVFLPDTAQEQRLRNKLDHYLDQVVRLGFLKLIEGREATYEIRRILKAFIDATWLQQFAQRLQQATGQTSEGRASDGQASDGGEMS